MHRTDMLTFAELLRSAITAREAATLRAALHCWQNELSYYTTEELRSYYPDLRGVEPLSIEDVEALLARLHNEAGNATVSAVSTEGAS